MRSPLLTSIQIAIEGCCHGELDNIYGTLQHLEKVEGRKIDLLISCGDFQVRCGVCSWKCRLHFPQGLRLTAYEHMGA
eukprot:69951-Pelagomonas_calceolata.AAC.2